MLIYHIKYSMGYILDVVPSRRVDCFHHDWFDWIQSTIISPISYTADAERNLEDDRADVG